MPPLRVYPRPSPCPIATLWINLEPARSVPSARLLNPEKWEIPVRTLLYARRIRISPRYLCKVETSSQFQIPGVWSLVLGVCEDLLPAPLVLLSQVPATGVTVNGHRQLARLPISATDYPDTYYLEPKRLTIKRGLL